ncbi:MAG: 2,3-bisphosphoglycerate-dependent phosphoglycerate mutase [Chlamydiia bacterium]|nr:2,3-bisphosphoglycerate-dependent phosphoglycerate mutase [Chlamydiia bacterium]MCH9614991.1 2,3-bisphosphoglycerate-dependent phosphoglycerate mutase [Chlamydiia bacterium]MCH9629959.1 2,3-bisphosphoglycerate-dependent phosphoglycerate mutase [Chlamydiia bacterium]
MLLLVRHGETPWNVEGRYQGLTDMELTLRGHDQARRLSKVLAKEHADIEAIHASDLKRAQATGSYLAERLDLEMVCHEGLRELDFGAVEGRLHDEVEEEYASERLKLDARYAAGQERWKVTELPGAETHYAAFLRMKQALLEIASLGGKRAVFTHGLLMGIFVAERLGKERYVALPNCCVVHVDASLQVKGIEDLLGG